MNSFELDLSKRNDIARNNLRLNAIISSLVLITAIFPIFMPWYADPNYEVDPAHPLESISIISRYRHKSETFIIFSLFSVFVKNEWMTIADFIDRGCPYVMKAGFECLAYEGFEYASYGVRNFCHLSE